MKWGKVAKDITVTGNVIVTERDDYGDEICIVISTDREDYIVEPNRLWKKLLDIGDEEVEVKGRLLIADDGNKRIYVRKYESIDDSG